jgi:hypothetical protein
MLQWAVLVGNVAAVTAIARCHRLLLTQPTQHGEYCSHLAVRENDSQVSQADVGYLGLSSLVYARCLPYFTPFRERTFASTGFIPRTMAIQCFRLLSSRKPKSALTPCRCWSAPGGCQTRLMHR